MLLHIGGEVVEIRPGELFESKSLVSSRFLEEIIKKPKAPPVVRKERKKKAPVNVFKEEVVSKEIEEELNGSSS